MVHSCFQLWIFKILFLIAVHNKGVKLLLIALLQPQGIIPSLRSPPIVLWFLVQTGPTVCPVVEESATAKEAVPAFAPGCSFENCQAQFPAIHIKREQAQKVGGGFFLNHLVFSYSSAFIMIQISF